MKIISLINMKGGVGKTTMAVNICDCLSRKHNKKVLLIDIDPQFNATQCLMSGDEYMEYRNDNKDCITTLFERSRRVVPSSVSGNQTITSKTFDDITPHKIKNNFDLLPGDLSLYKLEIAAGEGRENRLKKFLKSKESSYDYVIIDTPPTPSIWMTSALIASDYYLVPVKPEPLSFTGMDLLRGLIDDKKDDLDLSIKCIGVIITMAEIRTKVYIEAVRFLEKKPWKGLPFCVPIPKRTEIAREQTNTRYILDLGDNESKIALTKIVDELIMRIKNEK